MHVNEPCGSLTGAGLLMSRMSRWWPWERSQSPRTEVLSALWGWNLLEQQCPKVIGAHAGSSGCMTPWTCPAMHQEGAEMRVTGCSLSLLMKVSL